MLKLTRKPNEVVHVYRVGESKPFMTVENCGGRRSQIGFAAGSDIIFVRGELEE